MLAACLSLSVGTGLATAAFTLVNAVTFSDLPVPQPARIISLGTRVGAQRDMPLVSSREYVAFRDAQTAIRDVAAFTGGTVNISDGVAPPQRLSTAYVTPNTFRTLGVSPLLGRDFLDVDDDPNAPPVAILSEAIWSGRYGQDPQIIGRSLKVNGRGVSVIGVMPPGTCRSMGDSCVRSRSKACRMSPAQA
jgi:putative ABC transport system permease protein